MMTLPAVPPLAPPGYLLALGPVLQAGRWLESIPPEQHHEIEVLCADHDQNPHDVYAITYAVFDMPMLIFYVYDVNEDGRRYLVPETNKIAQHEVDVMLRTELPTWWRVDAEVKVGES